MYYAQQKRMLITSKDNAQVKRIASLMTKKGRKELSLCVLEGKRLVSECPSELRDQLVVSESCAAEYEDADLILADHIFESLSDTVNSQGVLLVARIPESVYEGGDCLYLETIQDPGNMGTTLRSARAFGFKTLFLSKDCVDVYAPKVLRSCMGALFGLQIIENASLDDIPQSCRVYAAALGGDADLSSFADFAEDVCLMIGNEGNGLSDAALSVCDQRLEIAMDSEVESLNAAVAASILMHRRSS